MITKNIFLSQLKDFLLKIVMKRNPLAVKGFSFQMIFFYCENFSSALQVKSFVVQRKYNFEDKRKQIV